MKGSSKLRFFKRILIECTCLFFNPECIDSTDTNYCVTYHNNFNYENYEVYFSRILKIGNYYLSHIIITP